MDSLTFGAERRQAELETWTKEELIDAVLTLETDRDQIALPYKAMVGTRQGPHRVQFAVGFQDDELFEVVRQAVTARTLSSVDEASLLAMAVNEYIHHYLCEAEHEWTQSQGRKFHGAGSII